MQSQNLLRAKKRPQKNFKTGRHALKHAIKNALNSNVSRAPDESTKTRGRNVQAQPISTDVAIHNAELVQAHTALKPIEQIQIGDYVWAWCEQAQAPIAKRVNRLYLTPEQPLYSVSVTGENDQTETIQGTREHPFWVLDKGWVPLCELKASDQLLLKSGISAFVCSKPEQDISADVLNFEVSDVHNYFVGSHGVLVHNSSEHKISLKEAVGTRNEDGTYTFTGDYYTENQRKLLLKYGGTINGDRVRSKSDPKYRDHKTYWTGYNIATPALLHIDGVTVIDYMHPSTGDFDILARSGEWAKFGNKALVINAHGHSGRITDQYGLPLDSFKMDAAIGVAKEMHGQAITSWLTSCDGGMGYFPKYIAEASGAPTYSWLTTLFELEGDYSSRLPHVMHDAEGMQFSPDLPGYIKRLHPSQRNGVGLVELIDQAESAEKGIISASDIKRFTRSAKVETRESGQSPLTDSIPNPRVDLIDSWIERLSTTRKKYINREVEADTALPDVVSILREMAENNVRPDGFANVQHLSTQPFSDVFKMHNIGKELHALLPRAKDTELRWHAVAAIDASLELEELAAAQHGLKKLVTQSLSSLDGSARGAANERAALEQMLQQIQQPDPEKRVLTWAADKLRPDLIWGVAPFYDAGQALQKASTPQAWAGILQKHLKTVLTAYGDHPGDPYVAAKLKYHEELISSVHSTDSQSRYDTAQAFLYNFMGVPPTDMLAFHNMTGAVLDHAMEIAAERGLKRELRALGAADPTSVIRAELADLPEPVRALSFKSRTLDPHSVKPLGGNSRSFDQEGAHKNPMLVNHEGEQFVGLTLKRFDRHVAPAAARDIDLTKEYGSLLFASSMGHSVLDVYGMFALPGTDAGTEVQLLGVEELPHAYRSDTQDFLANINVFSRPKVQREMDLWRAGNYALLDFQALLPKRPDGLYGAIKGNDYRVMFDPRIKSEKPSYLEMAVYDDHRQYHLEQLQAMMDAIDRNGLPGYDMRTGFPLTPPPRQLTFSRGSADGGNPFVIDLKWMGDKTVALFR